MGGANAYGSLGYLQMMVELTEQMQSPAGRNTFSELPQKFDFLYHACGSGGTMAGIVAGAKLLEYTLHRTRKGRAVPTRFVRVTGLKPAQGAKARAPELPPEDEEGNVQLL